MKWVTRERIQINRTATCWLIRRFIDPAAAFLFVPAEEVALIQSDSGATGFDAPGATYPHKDERGHCSFAALVYEKPSLKVGLLPGLQSEACSMAECERFNRTHEDERKSG